MPAIALKNPLGRVLNGAGRAGPRRLIVITVVALAALTVLVLVWTRSGSVETTATVARAPKANPLPGGPHTTPAYSDLATRHDREVAARAAAAGQSSVATMPGSDTAIRVPPAVVPNPTLPRPTETGVSTTSVTGTPLPIRPVATPYVPTTVAVQQQPKPDENQIRAYQAAISSLLAGWNGKPQLTEVVLKPEDEQRATGGSGSGPGHATANGGAAQNAAPAPPMPNAARIGGRSSGQVLMPAGRGVYARTVLAASSDQGGPVIVEALSGPIAGDRMSGSFERRENRLVVKLSSITLQDGTQHSIDALVIAPDSMETSVASNVDQHYVSRFVLPVAAAFVSGLGQAIEQSNSAFVASPFGGVTGVTHLNLGQQLGVGAGVAGAQLGAILKGAAPKGPTVSVEANVNVGVVFLAPLIVGER